MGPERIRAGALVSSLALACTAEPEAEVGEFSAGATESSGTSQATTVATSTSAASTAVTTTTADSESTSGTTDAGTQSDDGSDGPLLDVGSDDPPLGCATVAEQYIGLATIDAELYRYDPEDGTVESLGTFECEGQGLTVNALTIDRNGLLWTMQVDAPGFRRIYTVDPETLECLDTGYQDPDGYYSGGLAFVADAPDSDEESLYVGMATSIDGGTPLSIAKVDLATMEADVLGDLASVGNGYPLADMTGTGDARLFAFYNGSVVAEVDEATPSIVDQQMLPFVVGSPWAFAQWGARLYLFSSGMVRAFDPATGDVEVVENSLGVSVVGAAVSTCAPYEPEG